MKEIMIEIVNPQLEDMGVKQEKEYRPFMFFVCRNTKKNIDIFESV